MIKKYHLENTEETYLRIWQKVNFGKEVLEPKFFEEIGIKDSRESYRLSVNQFDPNTRLFFLDNYLYWVTSDEALYNYLDTGRVVSKKEYRGYGEHNKTIYLYNDLIIVDNEIINFEEYKDKDSLNLKVLSDIDNEEIKLIFKEDLDKIKTRLAEIKAEEKQIENLEIEGKIDNTQEEEKLISLIKNYDKMTLLEDTHTIINGNYFIDKDNGLKVEFKDKIVKLFTKDELVSEDRYINGHFIQINCGNFLDKLERIYRQGKWEEPIEKKLKGLDKKLLSFKIYSYDPETKVEILLKEIKIENNVNDKGKLRFKVNGIKMPIQKMSKILEFIGCCRYSNIDKATITERLNNFENYLEKIRLFSGTQLELLQGKTIEISLSGVKIPIHFNIMAEDKNNWEVSIDNFKIKKDYVSVKDSFRWLSGGGLTAISGICDTLQAGAELEDILIGKIRGYVEKRRIAEEKAEKLFTEFLDKNKLKVFKREGGYIVKGKLKNYIVKMKNDEDCGVWSYPANEYVCINEKTQAGHYLCKYDKLLQFCLVMLNDGNLRQEIHTIH